MSHRIAASRPAEVSAAVAAPRTGRVARTRIAALAGLVALLAGGCLPTPESGGAQGAAQLYQVFFAIALVVGGIVWGLATWMLVSHAIRRLRGQVPEGMPPQVHGSNRLEVTWTALPALTVLLLFGLTVLAVNRIDAVSPTPGARIDVTAFRWGWHIAYPDAGVQYTGAGLPGPDIVVPVGTPVQFTLRSNDVVHSFFVPQFLFKRDAIPGRTSVFDFTVQSPGTYRGQCAEFCGIGHSQMAFSIVAMPPDQFRAWLAQQKAGGPNASPSPPIVGPSSGASAGPAAPDAPLATVGASGPAGSSPAPSPSPGPAGSPAPSPVSPAPSSGDLVP
jgi:cytochrome c oxidase subunit 2